MMSQHDEREAYTNRWLSADVEIILDISRLISRGLHSMPTGVDRVEMAYARTLLGILGNRLEFAAVSPLGIYGRIEHGKAMVFLDALEARWANGGGANWFELRRTALWNLLRLWPTKPPSRPVGLRRYLVQASPNHLHRPEKVHAKLEAEGARFICVVFDLIPIDFPEYARPNGAAQHRLRVETMIGQADGLIAISENIGEAISRYRPANATKPLIRSALLGVDVPEASNGRSEGGTLPDQLVQSPYFLMVSTIEPRKNHLMLLHIWRKMVAEIGEEQTPQLVIVGRRGWENENIVDMLDRCEGIRANVVELSGLSDEALFPLMKGARAVLLPSFAEGFGMPVAEALAQGVPVICSDLDALREAGAGIPDYIDPIDGKRWMDVILDYARPESLLRKAQIARIADFAVPRWSDHVAEVLKLIEEIDAERE